MAAVDRYCCCRVTDGTYFIIGGGGVDAGFATAVALTNELTWTTTVGETCTEGGTAHTSQIFCTLGTLRDEDLHFPGGQSFSVLRKPLTTQKRELNQELATRTCFQLVELPAQVEGNTPAPFMRIFDELRYLRDLFVKNVRRLLRLLSTSTRKVRVHITKLLKQYYNLLFADAPTRVHQAMVDFNRWLTAVLEDTRAEGIEWGPSYGEKPWLALEEPQPQDDQLDDVFSVDNASTIQLLRAACEYYMTRCESLQQTNAGLATQLEEVKTQLKAALIRAFESQQALAREREVSTLQGRRLVMGVQIGDHLSQENSHGRGPTDLHQQITDAFRMLDVVRAAPREGTETAPTSEATSVSDFEPDSFAEEVEDGQAEDWREPEDTEDIEGALVEQKELLAVPPGHDDMVLTEGHEVLVSSPDVVNSEPSVGATEAISTYDGCDYEQLTKMQNSEEKSGGSWYRQALRSLKDKREQRRFLRKSRVESAKAPLVTTSTTDVVDKEAPSLDAPEFVQLVSIRDPAKDGDDSMWYRRALQHLNDERKRRVSDRDRDSFSSTISIVG
ncbi:hypothetical protein PHYPSEUDO_003135 [Phytophthora pseudosyringae]|uniref:Uncharacterized protein n=1 Tax=Phytophthora pseudosyringae TaxID=221518 RepID=A0A8T1WJN5_9STRA|nr:hypothetical protein PHYPSEUDO_003135 [Phytophthora pseudosyringae]